MGSPGQVCARALQEGRLGLIARASRFAKTLGPGLLFASTAIGVSHLVQSTRAGAEFGLLLIGAVIAANALKYPFFEYGTRYANATGTSLIDGYARLGRRALWLYIGITASTMLFVTAAVGAVGAGFFSNLLGAGDTGPWGAAALFGACCAILAVGRYRVLDSLIKVVAAVLVASTLAALALAVANGPAVPVEGFVARDVLEPAGLLFLVALMGWMPTAIDLSAWNSLWTLERMKQTRFRPRLREALLEFRLSYALTSGLAVAFVLLGALILHGTGRGLPDGGAAFAGAVVSLYTETIGAWSEVVISAAAFSIMFGTVIAVFDGYSRALRRCAELALPGRRSLPYTAFLAAIAAGSLAVVVQFGGSLTGLVDFATSVSFLAAPAIAIINYRLVTGSHLDGAARPGAALRALSVAGIAFLLAFSAVYVAIRASQWPAA